MYRTVPLVLSLLLALVGCTAAAPDAGVGSTVEHYGPGPLQVGEWFLPAEVEAPAPVVVLVHGGCYQAGYDRHLEDDVARRLSSEGFVVWNVDYRPPSAAPYPATFEDVSAAVDHLPSSRYRDRLDLARVALVGHSAGGQLALWAGSGSAGVPTPPHLRPRLVVAEAPLADLRHSEASGTCGGAVEELLGGTPSEEPGRYGAVDPALLPAGAPVVILHDPGDSTVPVSVSERYVEALGSGAAVRLVDVPGGHFAHLDPRAVAVDRLVEELAALRG